MTLSKLRGVKSDHIRHPHPVVKNRHQECYRHIAMLKNGPSNIPKIIESHQSGGKWTDTDFNGKNTLYSHFTSDRIKRSYDSKFDDGYWNYYFARLSAKYPGTGVFGDDRSLYWKEPRQGGAGTCYIISAMSGVGEFPDLIRNAFLTQEQNSAGIFGIRFFIRGKPWVVTIDDEFLFYNPSYRVPQMVFTKPTNDNPVLWASILEKAWAKVKGEYSRANGGFVASGIRSITGSPVYVFRMSEVAANPDGANTYYTINDVYTMLKAANTNNYIMGAGTAGNGNDQEKNRCNIAMSHAYSIVDAFELVDANRNTHKMLMIRNPWGTAYYNG